MANPTNWQNLLAMPSTMTVPNLPTHLMQGLAPPIQPLGLPLVVPGQAAPSFIGQPGQKPPLAKGGAKAGAAVTCRKEEEAEVQKCHLHRKANKACKFCKRYTEWAELQEKRRGETKDAAIEQLKHATASKKGMSLASSDKAPVPNFAQFPAVLAEKIKKTDAYIKVSRIDTQLREARGNMPLDEVMSFLIEGRTCDLEQKNKATLECQPSPFICVVYRLLQVGLTEGDLRWLMKHDDPCVRCAAFLYVRLGFHCDRYWDCLSESLMDDEEFVPFTSKSGESYSMTIGEYVERLLVKQDYGESTGDGYGKDKYKEKDLPLPRIPLATKTKLARRICLYPQFRKRYTANVEVTEYFADGGVDVEVCSVDGEWRSAVTRDSGSRLSEPRGASALVAYEDGVEEYVSIGRLIVPRKSSSSRDWDASDLTRHRGTSAEELFESYNDEVKGRALARGTDYCKPSVQKVCVGGFRFLAGEKRGRSERVDDQEKEERQEEESRARRQQQREQEEQDQKRAKLAAIESKYCARVPAQDTTHVPDRLRLG